MWLSKNWAYGLLAIAVVLAILGVTTSNFVFKSGTAGMGIIIILGFLFGRKGNNKNLWMLVGAFVCSIIGDWFLSRMNGDVSLFVKGIALFFLAHVGYLVYALLNGKMHWKATAIVLIGFLAFFFLVLYPKITDTALMAASLIYLLISCFSLGASMGMAVDQTEKWSYVVGIGLILFSDTIIAFKEFVGYHTFDFLITPTYYLAHICITYSVIKRFEAAAIQTPNVTQ